STTIPLIVFGTRNCVAGPTRDDGWNRLPALPAWYVFSAMVGMARCAVPARVAAGGTNDRAAPAFEGVAPLHAARTSQRDVPTKLNTYPACSSREIARLAVSRAAKQDTARIQIDRFPAIFREVIAGIGQTKLLLLRVFG